MALKCSDATVVSNILNLLFNIYHGSEGKLSTSEQKINILQVIIKYKYIHLLFYIYVYKTLKYYLFLGNRKF